jgi:hypothetical protein
MHPTIADSLPFVGPGSEWFWGALTGLVTAVTFLAIYKQLRLQAGSSARDELLGVIREWEAERMLRMRLAALQDMQAGPIPRYSVGWDTCNYWEMIGSLTQDGHMNVKVMKRTIGSHVVGWWTVMAAEIDRVRAEYAAPDLWDHFEWLAVALADENSGVIAEARTAATPDRLADAIAALDRYIRLEEQLRAEPTP